MQENTFETPWVNFAQEMSVETWGGLLPTTSASSTEMINQRNQWLRSQRAMIRAQSHLHRRQMIISFFIRELFNEHHVSDADMFFF